MQLDLGFEYFQDEVAGFDGTPIVYQSLGNAQGPAIVFANGLGARFHSWRLQFPLFAGRYKLLSWDYRGLFKSGRPGRLSTLSVDAQVRDAVAVLNAEGVQQALFIGWSMGVQVCFELYRRHPERVSGLVALSGVAGNPFEPIPLGTLVAAGLPPLLQALRINQTPLRWLSRSVGRRSGLARALKQMRLVAPSLDEAMFRDVAWEFAELDFETYLATLLMLARHDARDVLHRVTVPVLVIAGGRDRYVPLSVADEMARSLPHGQLAVIEQGTHYAAAEFPHEVNEHLRNFVRGIGYGPLP